MDKRQLLAMISLLDDSDTEVINTVTGNLLQQGTEVIPDLERAWEGTPSEKVQARLENLIQEIQFNGVKDDLFNWVNTGAGYIMEGAYYVARFQFPEISMGKINEQIESIRKDVWLEINNNLTALEKVKILNYIIFDLHKFSRNNADFYSPQNFYINKVKQSNKNVNILFFSFFDFFFTFYKVKLNNG